MALSLNKISSAGNYHCGGELDEYTISSSAQSFQWDATKNYSVLFNGTNQRISTGVNTTTASVMTFECFFYLTDWLRTTGAGGYLGTFFVGTAGGNDAWCRLSGTASSITTLTHGWAGFSGGPDIAWGVNLSINTWYHLAISRNGSTWAAWLNGVKLTLTNNTNPGNNYNVGNMLIGAGNGGTGYDGYFPGYISNFRIVTGTNIYNPTDSTIFVPDAPLKSTVSGTLLLQCAASTVSGGQNGPVATSFTPFTNRTTKLHSNGTFRTIGELDEYTINPNVQTFQWDTTKLYSAGINLTTNNGEYFSPGFTSPTNQLWTMECWVYFTRNLYFFSGGGYAGTIMSGSNSGNGFGGIWWLFTGTATTITTLSVVPISSYVGYNLAATGLNLQINTWYHVAASRNGGTGAIWINGVKTNASGNGSTAPYNAFPMRIGVSLDNPGWNNFFPGYISNFRVVEGSNLYSITGGDIFVPDAPLKSGITNQTAFCAASSTGPFASSFSPFTSNRTTKLFSNGTFRTTGEFDEYIGINRYATSFNNTNQYLSMASNSLTDQVWGTSSTGYTVEMWFYGMAGVNHLYVHGANDQNRVYLIHSGSGLSLGTSIGGSFFTRITSSVSTPSDTWHHVALVRYGTGGWNYSMYVNGIFAGSSTAQTYQGGSIYLGTQPFSPGPLAGDWLNGYIYKFRMSVGSLYSSNFTPKPIDIEATANTIVLTCDKSTIIDSSSYNNTINNPAGAPTVLVSTIGTQFA